MVASFAVFVLSQLPSRLCTGGVSSQLAVCSARSASAPRQNGCIFPLPRILLSRFGPRLVVDDFLVLVVAPMARLAASVDA